MTTCYALRGSRGLLLVLLLLVLPMPARGYVLMGEHILDRMVQALGRAETLSASQTLFLHDDTPPLPSPVSLTETVFMRRPNAFRGEASGAGHTRKVLLTGGDALMAVDGILQREPPPRYVRYHDVLILKPRQALVAYLRQLGIDVTLSSLGRWEDTYCYVVGARFPDEEAPQLWVAKDTFLPFRLMLPPSDLRPGSGPVEIRYRNWTFVDDAAYPLHVVTLENHQIMQEIRVDRVQVNPVLPEGAFDPAAFRNAHARPSPEDRPSLPQPQGGILSPGIE
jgi:hypothetical protein